MPALSGAYVTFESLLELTASTKSRRFQRRLAATKSGLVHSKVKGRGLDFDEVRAYQPGDDVRTIDWKVTARLQKPHTKVFREEQERPCLFVADQSQSMFFGSKYRLKSVLCAEILGRLAWSALERKDKVGGLVWSNTGVNIVKPRRNKSAVANLLQYVASANQALKPRLEDQDNIVNPYLWSELPVIIRRLATSNNALTIISDFQNIDDSTWKKVLSFSSHNQVNVYYTYDQLETELPPAGRYSVSDGLSTFDFHSGHRANRDEHRANFEHRRDQLHSDCINRGIQFTAISTTDDVEALVFNA